MGTLQELLQGYDFYVLAEISELANCLLSKSRKSSQSQISLQGLQSWTIYFMFYHDNAILLDANVLMILEKIYSHQALTMTADWESTRLCLVHPNDY